MVRQGVIRATRQLVSLIVRCAVALVLVGAGCSAPQEQHGPWNLPLAIAPGSEASFLVLDHDPRTNFETLLKPAAIWHRGRRIR